LGSKKGFQQKYDAFEGVNVYNTPISFPLTGLGLTMSLIKNDCFIVLYIGTIVDYVNILLYIIHKLNHQILVLSLLNFFF